MAHNYSINKVPDGITHSAPMATEKDLNTTFQRSSSSHQSDRTFYRCVNSRYIYRNMQTCIERSHANGCYSLQHYVNETSCYTVMCICCQFKNISALHTHTQTNTHTHTHTHTHTCICTRTTTFQSCVHENTQECMGLTGTHCSCISRVGTGTTKVAGVLATLC